MGERGIDVAHEAGDTAAPTLRFSHVDKAFAGVRAVDDVSFDCASGEIVALLGENGAGKSTLIKILAGVYRRDRGRVLFNGQDVDEPDGRRGLAFIHQDLGLIEWMTVAENMALGYGFGPSTSVFRPFSKRDVSARAAAALERVGGSIDPSSRVFDLARTEKSLLAIARALAMNATFLVLDEPTASLPHADVERLFGVLRGLQSRGVGMIYVSHRLDEVFRIADRVAVMRNGRLVGNVATADATQDDLVTMIVGRELDRVRTSAAPDVAAPIRLALGSVRIGDVGPVDLAIQAGEIIGLVGLRGAGQASVGRTLAGVEPMTGGSLHLDGNPVSLASVGEAASHGISFATSNREAEGLLNGLSVRENIFANPSLWGRKLFEWRSRGQERQRAMEVIDRFGIRPRDSEKAAEALSGGNQQKVILSRWIGIPRRALVLEEPTMGVDVGAKADIYGLLAEVVAAGTAIVVVSTDFEEVATICHRAIVFSRGRPVAELVGEQITIAALLAAASGTTEGELAA